MDALTDATDDLAGIYETRQLDAPKLYSTLAKVAFNYCQNCTSDEPYSSSCRWFLGRKAIRNKTRQQRGAEPAIGVKRVDEA